MTQKSSLGDRLMEIIHHFHLNMNSFSVKLGLSSNSIIVRVVNDPDRGLSYEVLQKIGEIFGIDMNWLVLGIGKMLRSSNALNPEYHYIPYYKKDEGDPVDMLRIHGYEDCNAAFDVHGDLMAPKFRPGDIVICKETPKDESLVYGEAYRFIKGGAPIIRYLRTIPEQGKLKLGAESDRFEDSVIGTGEIEKVYIIKGVIRREAF